METEMQLSEKSTLLLTEGRPGTRHLMGRTLEAQGYEVLYARNSVEALLIALEHPGNLDALITDCEQRGYHNGLELAACFHELWPEARIVITGRPPTTQEARILREMAVEYVHAPSPRNPDEIMGLRKLLRQCCPGLHHSKLP